MKRIYECRFVLDEFNQIIEYRFEPHLRDQIAAKFQFESEDSNFAPEPSVASMVQAENGYEYGLVYLQQSNQLMVLAELNWDRTSAIETFMAECPELSPHLLQTYATPPSPYPPPEVFERYLQRAKSKGLSIRKED